MDMFTQWCPPQKKEGMVTSQGGMSEAFSDVVQMATEKRRFTKSPPQKKQTTRGDVPGGSRFGNALSRSVISAELDM
jgi:hypothetical protein